MLDDDGVEIDGLDAERWGDDESRQVNVITNTHDGMWKWNLPCRDGVVKNGGTPRMKGRHRYLRECSQGGEFSMVTNFSD